MKQRTLTHPFVLLCLLLVSHVSSLAQCGTCTLTQSNLIAATGTYTIPAGQTLCISSNTCLGSASNYPGSCANTGPGSLVINGTLRVCANVVFKYQGSIVGSGKLEIMSAGRFSLYGTYDCSQGLIMTAVDPTISSGTSTTSTISACNSAACEPHFSNGYAPLGVVATGLGYTVNGACTGRGYPDNFVLLPAALTSWKAGWQGRSIHLGWTMASQGIKSFEIDYSADGEHWYDISGTLPARRDDGAQTYGYTAGGPFSETNYFRLKMVLTDDSYTNSPIEMVAGNLLSDNILISPNPVQSFFTLRYNGITTISSLQLMDVAGTTVLSLASHADGRYTVDKLAPGTYFVQVLLADGSRVTRKITKL
ncbi:MAG: T9SS type A sorting domain-containing protein [Bacteroidetes bacterium]|nr:T9SS type A sorting domain-containing protein [Bacteroidota bacterium]